MSGRPSPRAAHIALLLLLIALFTWQSWSRRWYNDDTFITFRYSENLAGGLGFAWNSGGEPVEGSTSLGWMLIHALGIRLGFDPLPLSHVLGLLCGALALAGLWYAAWKLARLDPASALLAPLALVLARQWLLWSVAGLETRAATLAVFAATAVLAAEHGRERPGFAGSGLLFFLATLLRPEVPLLHLAAGGAVAVSRRGRTHLFAVVASGGLHMLLLAALMAWRYSVFGSLLPNTFYAKVGGVQPALGLRYAGEFFWQNGGVVWVPLLLAGLWLLRRRLPLIVVIWLAQALVWTVWIVLEGGGAWEFRFFDVLLPGLGLTIAVSSRAVAEACVVGRRRGALVAGLALLAAAALAWPTFRGFRDFFPTVSARSLVRSADEMLREGRILGRWLGPEDRICIGWAGAMPYVSRAWHFDPFGLNDREIARREFRKESVLFHQRHAEWEDVKARQVMFCDIFNQFLYRRPYAPNQVPKSLMPWARDGIMVHCIELPPGTDLRYWIFASPRPRDEIRAWAEARGLRLVYSAPLIVGGPPRATRGSDG